MPDRREWRDEAAGLDATESRLWRVLQAIGDVILAGVAADLEAKTGLSAAEFAVLAALEENETPPAGLAQARLCALLGWDKSRLSHLLTRMADRHFVRRERDRESRSTLVFLRSRGRAAIASARGPHAASVRRLALGFVAAEERDALLAIGDRIEPGRPRHAHTDPSPHPRR